MLDIDFLMTNLEVRGFIVEIDETMMNYKCKSHRNRSPSNRTDSICIVEIQNRMQRAIALVIPDKREATLIPIICSQVFSNSIIFIDEAKCYSKLNQLEFVHENVCHKYEFMNSEHEINTQAIENFHNKL